MKDKLPGGKGDNRPDSDFDPKWLAAGIKVEMEHTDDKDLAKEIAKDHLTEDKLYYKKLRTIEKSMRDEMLKSTEIEGGRGGKYHLSKTGKKVYNKQAAHNIITATKHALHHLRSGKLGSYDKARAFLSQHDNHSDENVRHMARKAHEVLGRAAQEMVGRSKTVKAKHIYGLIHKHHESKSQPEKPVRPSKSEVGYRFMEKQVAGHHKKAAEHFKAANAKGVSEEDQIHHMSRFRHHKYEAERKTKDKATWGKKMTADGRWYNQRSSQMEKSKKGVADYVPMIKESVDIIKKLKTEGAHNKGHNKHPQYRAELRSLKYNMEQQEKQILHLEKRRDKKGKLVSRWVGAKKPVKTSKKKASKPLKGKLKTKPPLKTKKPVKTKKPATTKTVGTKEIRHTTSTGLHFVKKTKVPYTHVVEVLHNGTVKPWSWHKTEAAAERSLAADRVKVRRHLKKLNAAAQSGEYKNHAVSMEALKNMIVNETNYLNGATVRPINYIKPFDQMTDAEIKTLKKTEGEAIKIGRMREHKGHKYTIEKVNDGFMDNSLYYPHSVTVKDGMKLYKTAELADAAIKNIIDNHNTGKGSNSAPKPKGKIDQEPIDAAITKVKEKVGAPKPKIKPKGSKMSGDLSKNMKELQLLVDSITTNKQGREKYSGKANWEVIERGLKEPDLSTVQAAIDHIKKIKG